MKCPHCGKQIDISSMKEEMSDESRLQVLERDKIINDLRSKLSEASKRIDNYSHSQQLSGETLEISIEEELKRLYILDEIIEVKKGQLGADIIQVVKTKEGIEIGRIIFEIKNTQAFSSGWLPKLKKDNLKAKADIMILVTNTLPKDINKFGFIDGIWVCHYTAVADLVLALRFGLFKLQALSIVQQGRASKSELMYDYVMSEEFKNLFESVLEGVTKIRNTHEQEKIKMALLWKEREKSFEQILSNSLDFFGTLRGIAGNAIHQISTLETPSQVD
jgi:hypothetical protein